MEPGGSMLIHKGSPMIPILSRITPIPRIDAYLFKVYFYIVLPFRSWISRRARYPQTIEADNSCLR